MLVFNKLVARWLHFAQHIFLMQNTRSYAYGSNLFVASVIITPPPPPYTQILYKHKAKAVPTGHLYNHIYIKYGVSLLPVLNGLLSYAKQ
jgi:hypothetical protein